MPGPISPESFAVSGTRRLAFLIGLLVLPDIAFAQQVGDEIVVVEQAPLRAASRRVDIAEAGTVLRVRAVWRNQLLVSKGIPGWIDLRQTLPIAEGQRHFDALVSRQGASLEALCARARFLIARRDFPAARDDLDRARLISAGCIEVAILTAECSLAMRDFNGAIEHATAALAIDPTSADMHVVRGRALKGRGELDAALLSFARAQELAPHSGVPHYYLADARYELGQLDKSRQATQEGLARDPWNVTGLAWLGMLLGQDEQYLSAVSHLTRAIRLGPATARMYGSRAVAYSLLEDYESALQDANRAIELDPASAPSFGARGSAHFGLERYQEALDDFEKAIELGMQSPAMLFECGVVQLKLDRPELAVLAFDAGLRMKPEDHKAWSLRGIAHSRIGEHQAAIADLTTAIKLAPDTTLLYFFRACAHLYADDPQNAEADLEAYRRLSEGDGELPQTVALRDLVKLVQ